MQALAAAKLAEALDDKVDPEQVSKLLDKLLVLYDVKNTAKDAFLCIARLTELGQASVLEKLK